MPTNPKLKGWAIVAMYLSPGVSRGGSGIAIVNGKVIKVPPRGPVLAQIQGALQQLAAGRRTGGR